MEIVEKIRGNPLKCLCGVICAVLLFLGGVWAVFTPKTIPDLYAEGGLRAVTIRAAIWLVIFLFLSTVIIQLPWTQKLRNNAKGTTRMSLFIVAIVGAAIGVAIWVWLVPGAPNAPGKEQGEKTAALPPDSALTQRRHRQLLTPFQIYNKVNGADPLQKESVARALHNGTVDWTLRFNAVKSVRGAPDKIEVSFGDHNADLSQGVRFEIPRQGHEYFNPFRPQDQHWYRVTGVISEVVLDDDNNFRFIKLAEVSFEEASAPPLPGESPSPREVGPKVVPPKKPDLVVEAETGPRDVPPPQQKSTTLQKEVSALFKDRTAVKVIDLLQPFKGRTIEVHGTLFQMQLAGPNEYYAIIQNPEGTPVLVCFFKSGAQDKLRALDQNTPVQVRGTIAPDQNGLALTLRDCELQ